METENLLSFLTLKLKLHGMTVDELCKKIGISRQKFYRFVKEPQRFSEDSVHSLIDALSLKSDEIDRLELYLHPKQPGTFTADPAVFGGVIEGLFKRRLSEELTPELDTIEYMQTDCRIAMESPASLARMIADSYSAAPGQAHDFLFTVYNCIPMFSGDLRALQPKPNKGILTIASLMKELEDALLPPSSAEIRIRHFLSERRYPQLKEHTADDASAMLYHLYTLHALLPLLSMAKDYSFELSETLGKSSMDFANVCLIRHTCSFPSAAAAADGASFAEASAVSSENARSENIRSENIRSENARSENTRSEFYILMFSEDGKCSACRLGSEDISHIYRFILTNIRGTGMPSAKKDVGNPNQFYYQMDKDRHFVQIHPDLCFDDIPKQVWLALYDAVQKRSDRAKYEAAFRQLMDPYDLYAFLDFGSLADAMIDTIDRRNKASAANGKSVIFHPEGLLNMVRSGIISDLSAEVSDYKGQYGDLKSLRFPAPVIRSFLMMIKESILHRQVAGITDPSKCDWTNYYIFQPNYPCPEISFYLYDDFGVAPLYIKGRHKHLITNFFENAKTGTLLYNYAIKEMIGKRGEKLGSAIMSDEHSIVLLDRLISMVDEGDI